MLFKNIPFCFFPTTIVIVDDSESFTNMMQAILSDSHLSCSFNQPEKALIWLKEQSKLNLTKYLVTDIHSELDVSDETHENVQVDLESFHKIVYQSDRFEMPSVIVVDYSMPVISGFELCRELIDSPIKKLMLTGHADEKTAVQAFNESLINGFFFKSAKQEDIKRLKKAIAEQEMDYFENFSKHWRNQLKSVKKIVENPEFIELFNKIIHENHIVEFYLIDKWGSYLLLDADGAMFILALRDKAECDGYYQIAEMSDKKIDDAILNQLRDHSRFPFFYSEEEYELPATDWEDYLHPAKTIDHFCYSLILNDRIPKSFKTREVVSFLTYQSQLDD